MGCNPEGFPWRGKIFSTVWKTAILGGMKILALECSTDAASVALLEDGAVVAAAGLDASRRRSQGLFDAVASLLSGAGWDLEGIGAYAVGRGPGAYTGLRVSLTAANGWALPGGKPVWTVSSGAVRAAEVLAGKPGAAQVVAWGDARRGMIWAGLFERDGGGVRHVGEWLLMPAAEKPSIWHRAFWIDPGYVPQAGWVGRLFFAGGPSEERQPIYLNPAVGIAPRFDANGQALAP